jgi:hypothetical protein
MASDFEIAGTATGRLYSEKPMITEQCEGQGWIDCTGPVERVGMCDFDEEIRPDVGKMCHCCQACRYACWMEI